MERKIVKKLPKVELHCHLDGSVSVETLLKIAKKQQMQLSVNAEQLAKMVTAPKTCQNLMDYLACFDTILPFLQTAYALEEAAYDVISQAAADSVAYIEVRFAPSLHTKNGLSFTQIVTAVLAGLRRGEQDFGVKSNALLCGMRHEDLQDIEHVVHLANQLKTNGVVGFDLAGNEADFPPQQFQDILALAAQLTIPLTLHAGECGCGKNVVDAIHLGASRIGHGIAVKDLPEAFPFLKEKNILMEMCPTSNFQTKTVTHLAEYPFQTFLDAQIPVCINTDNRTVSNTNLTEEYMKLHAWYRLTYQDMHQLNHYAVQGAFISDAEKKSLQQQLDHGYAAVL